MFTSLQFARDQITQQGLTELCIDDSTGHDRLGYYTGKPNDCAAWLESSIAQLSGPLVVKAWNDDARKAGAPGEKRKGGIVHRWRIYGTHGAAAAGVPAAAAPAPVADVKGAVADAVEAARKDWALAAHQEELKRMAEQIEQLRAELMAPADDDDNDDDDDQPPAEQVDMVRELVGMLKDALRPQLPAPVAGAAAAPMTGVQVSEEEHRILAALRNARTQHPAEMDGYISTLLNSYGAKP